MIKGCDISNWQSKFPAGYAFYIMKATEGVGFTDKKMGVFASSAENQGKPIGFYHFARPDLGNSAEKEADYFLKVVGPYLGRAVLALDLECSNYQYYTDWAKKWLQRVYNKTGIRPLLYIPGYYAYLFRDIVKQTNTGVWAPSTESYYTGMTVVMSQSVVNGLDIDYFYGTAEQFKKYGQPGNSKKVTKKSNNEIAAEVIAGKWGNGATRKAKLSAAGYDYTAIQKIVNARLSRK